MTVKEAVNEISQPDYKNIRNKKIKLKCANCGGMIYLGEKCESCGIEYYDMVNDIRHSEMKRLFKKIEEIKDNHGDILLEGSLLACELENSTLIIPATIVGNEVHHIALPDKKGNPFFVAYTDMDEFRKSKCNEYVPLACSWKGILRLLRSFPAEGILINPFNEVVSMSNLYLDHFFGDEND